MFLGEFAMAAGAVRISAEMQQHLFAQAKAARARAYCPYSGYAVGAAILSVEGGVFHGCNVENAAYASVVHAEVGAISAMIAAGDRHIAALAVIGNGDTLVTPCGACRQVIFEFANSPDMPIYMCDSAGIAESVTLATLLPYAFGPRHLID
jgi:cytidine deaminase